jgi:tripartite-type tricarboxylate transporter receptor subunit TctC
MRSHSLRAAACVAAAGFWVILAGGAAEAAWQPTKPVEFVIMAGPGGGADIYARFISGLIAKEKLAPVSFVPLNRDGGAGAVAMEYTKAKEGDPHTIMITLSSFIMTPMMQRLPFSYKNFTPVALLALDNFWLWANKESPFKSVADVVAECKQRGMKVAGTGSRQEDELIFAFFEQRAGCKPFGYVPFKGGGTVAANLVGKHVELTVNNPSEGLPHYPEKLAALATFAEKRHEGTPYKDLATMKELGYPITYQMIRGIFGPPNMPAEAQEYYVGLMRKVFELKEFQDFLAKNVLAPEFKSGSEFMTWLDGYNDLHKEIMTKAGWLK